MAKCGSETLQAATRIHGSDHPNPKDLNKYVTPKIPADEWENLGLELLGNTVLLGDIKATISGTSQRCNKMFEKWLQGRNTTWNRLIDALEEVKLTNLADELKKMFTSTSAGVDKSTGGHGESCSSPTSRQRSSDYPDAPGLEKEYEDNIQCVGKIVEKAEVYEKLKDPKLKVLIQTVNKNEFHAAMLQLEDYNFLKCIVNDPICGSSSHYHIGHWGKVKVAIVQTGMGNNGAYGSWYETKKAMHFIPNLRYIFSVGVCGGVNGKVELGDVVVSKVIAGYTDLKITDEGWINRSPKKVLTGDDFFQFLSKAETKREVKEKPKFGTVLSAPWLIASTDMQKQLMKELPEAKEAIAFEMEGHGIVQACEGKEIECMVVKGVSDLADKNKKDNWQPTAAKSATRYLKKMMKKAEEDLPTWLLPRTLP